MYADYGVGTPIYYTCGPALGPSWCGEGQYVSGGLILSYSCMLVARVPVQRPVLRTALTAWRGAIQGYSREAARRVQRGTVVPRMSAMSSVPRELWRQRGLPIATPVEPETTSTQGLRSVCRAWAYGMILLHYV